MTSRAAVDLWNDVYDETQGALIIEGDEAHDAADAGSPVKIGGKASTSLPTAVSNADRVNTYHNEYGEVGTVGGAYYTIVSQQPTVTGAYTSGDACGGKLTFANAVRKTSGAGTIEAVIVVDDGGQGTAAEIVLFNQDFTATNDNAAFTPTDADLENCLGYVPVAAADFKAFADNSLATVRSVGLPFVLSGSTSLYGQMVTRGTPTYASSSDLTIKLVIREH